MRDTENSYKNRYIKKIQVAGDRANIFDTRIPYVIPFYQRAFEWEDKQLLQMVEDIDDLEGTDSYYLGTLVMARRKGRYEVVDGQQRLTALFLLLSCLGFDVKNTLEFECRDKSNYTLRNIRKLLGNGKNSSDGYDADRIEEGIRRGLDTIHRKITDREFDRAAFVKKLKRVMVYRIQVPENTDLNRYFEIMNTRGEQLEQHDILKAKLMEPLGDSREQAVFARIWDACSDMNGYVQMHFSKEFREHLFGDRWNSRPTGDWNEISSFEPGKDGGADGTDTFYSIREIVREDFRMPEQRSEEKDDTSVRFEGIIEFPFFLLHVLRVFVRKYRVTNIKGKELLDDKKLRETFDEVLEQGIWNKNKRRISGDRAAFSRRFICCLLETRFLFDKYIIKREFVRGSRDGEWSLKELSASGRGSRKHAYYAGTKAAHDSHDREWNVENLMIQSALRVSYTSPKVMHWMTELLYWLSKNHCRNTQEEYIGKYAGTAEQIAAKAVREKFFEVCGEDGKYCMGVNTPHIVFHYLDYLLWKSDPKLYGDFTFEFRNSVEHWYPQNPPPGTIAPWDDDGLDSFGNLCIVTRKTNLRFSNMPPENKGNIYAEAISKGSLKLRIMDRQTVASMHWRQTACKAHEEEMIALLKEACGYGSEENRT